MPTYLEYRTISEINSSDPFFYSLKEDYAGFDQWLYRKKDEKAYILIENDYLQGFLYLKVEDGPITDVEPVISQSRVLKIGTLKINPHGTRLGERFIKKALDHAIENNSECCYVTVFEKHKALIDLLTTYGFIFHGTKGSNSNLELVLIKQMNAITNDVLLDYPMLPSKSTRKFLLSIYPQYHSRMFPDSILKNESFSVLEDTSHTNSIHKIYVCNMCVENAAYGDIIVIYRTKDDAGHAEYRSVATSLCRVEEVRRADEFNHFEEFFQYSNTYSIFDKGALRPWYEKNCRVIKMTYNAAFKKRLTRQRLADNVGLNRDDYWGFMELTDAQFQRILEEGDVSEGIIID